MKQDDVKETHIDAVSFGAKADGTSDDTAAIQKALDAAGQQGGAVRLAAGKYLVAGSLKIPEGVALVGSNQAPVYIEPLIGTVILATGGRDQEEASALFEMGNSSTVQGVTVFYPDQKPDDIHPYAWTFHLQGGDNTVENVTLINSYNGIKIGPEVNVRHRIRSVSGCVLRRGIWLDNCTDIGRIENVQPHALRDGGDARVARGRVGLPVVGGVVSPGNAPSAITVGAVNTKATPRRSDDVMATYSSRGPTYIDGLLKPDLVAPGNKIVSAAAPGSAIVRQFPDRVVAGSGNASYIHMSGTSMSAAVVSGAAALMLEANPALRPAQVKFALQVTSSRIDRAGLVEQGAGSLNTAAAVTIMGGRRATNGFPITSVVGEAQ